MTTSGGTGTGLTWTVTSGGSQLTAIGLSLSSAGVLSGSSPSAGSATFGVKVTDSASNAATATLSVTINGVLTLPNPNPTTLPSGVAQQSYTGSIVASGGVGPTYTWTVNGLGISQAGLSVTLSDGLSATTTDNNTLSITGTPTSATPAGTPISFSVTVSDSDGHSAGPVTYTIVVNSAGSQVSGQIWYPNYCGNNNSLTLPQFTVSINTTPVQTAYTDGSGNYSFATVPNGTYTITPTMTGSNLPEYEFYPATLTNVVVDNNAISGENFGVMLGYTVSGTVTYGGSTTGPIYLQLNNQTCGPSNGTTISTPGSFTIRGVSLGTYNLNSWRDNLG